MVSGLDQSVRDRLILQSYFEKDLSGNIKQYKYGFVDEGIPKDIIIQLYPIQGSFKNKIMGIFGKP